MHNRRCKHCKIEFDISDKPKGWMANHSRWCDSNPKKNTYKQNMKIARAGITEESRKKQSEGIKQAHKSGKYDHVVYTGFIGKHSDETKQLIRKKALASKHRRLRKGVVYYKGVMLDSSWELELAKRLDYLCIEWIRPEPIPWIDDEGIEHNYFADFYLPAYDLYLDPKNKHAIKVQERKLKKLLTQYSNIVILDSLDKCKTYEIKE